MIDLSKRDRVADLNALAAFILQGLYTWAMPADLGVDYGYQMGGWGTGPRRINHRSYLSVEKILHVIGIKPEKRFLCEKCEQIMPSEDTYEGESGGMGHSGCWGRVKEVDWPPAELADYARGIWQDVGAVLRTLSTREPR